jgi:PAS domain S-box-containing protein
MDEPPFPTPKGGRPKVDPMLTAAVMASRSPMVVTDPNRQDNPMVLVNQAFCRMTGYPPEELLGRNCRMLQGPQTDPDAVASLGQAIAARREVTVDLLNYRRGGDTFWSEVFVAPIYAADGSLRHFIGSQQDSTERRRSELAQDPRLAGPQAPRIASWRWEPLTGQMTWSEAASQVFGIAVPASVGFEDWAELIHPDDRDDAARAARAILKLGQMTFEYRVDRSGAPRWIEAAGNVVLRDESGRAVLISGVVTDITRRREAEYALRTREARTRLALDAARAGAWELDTRTGRAITSPRHDEILGHSQMRGAWTLDRFRETLLAADRTRSISAIQDAIGAREPFHLEARIHAAPGLPPRWIEAWGRPAAAGSGNYYGIVVDVTERKRAEEGLIQAEAAFRLALEAAELGRWDHDLVSGSPFWDDRMRQMFGGLTPLQGDREAFLARIHPDDLEGLLAGLARAQMPDGDGRFVHRFRLASPAGEAPRWLHCTGQALFDQGQCTRFLGVCQDVTEDTRTALALQDMNATLEAEVAARTAERDRTWRLSQELLAVTVAGEGMVSVNPSWQRVLGWTPAQLRGRSLLELVHPDDLPATTAEMLQAEAGVLSLQFRNRCRTADGKYRYISWTTVPEGGTFYLSGRDVTGLVESAAALEQAEAQLRQLQKMEAVGQLTGGIAHDFNNMLSVVIGGLSLVQRRLDRGNTDVATLIEAAMDGARRAGALTQRLLAFSRQQPLQPQVLDLGQVVTGMSELLRRTLGETIQLELSIAGGRDPDCLWIHVDPSQMENVILNLALNARDAMPGGGRLTIALDHLTLAAEQADDLPAGSYAVLRVTDTGEGMSSEVLARAFEPFFTTKGVGVGTGLGLSQVYGFVRQSGGTARIQSQLGQGSSVTLILPCHDAPDLLPDNAAAQLSAPRHGDGETVLLVEDEERVRHVSADALSDLGYKVIVTDGAAAALVALETHARIDLLFTDVVMPEVNGRDLALEARRRRPGLKVLFTTGYAKDTVVHDGVVDPGTHLLTKPFTVDQLAAKLRELFDRH